MQHKLFIIYNFTTLDSISTATMITEYCRIAYASNMFIWTKFRTAYQNFVLPLISTINLIFIHYLFFLIVGIFLTVRNLQIKKKS